MPVELHSLEMSTVNGWCFYCAPDRTDNKRIARRECILVLDKHVESLTKDDIIKEPHRGSDMKLVICEVHESTLEWKNHIQVHSLCQYYYQSFVKALCDANFPKYSTLTTFADICVYQIEKRYFIVRESLNCEPRKDSEIFLQALQHYTHEKSAGQIDFTFNDSGNGLILLNSEKSNLFDASTFFKSHTCTELCNCLHLPRHPLQPDYKIDRVGENRLVTPLAQLSIRETVKKENEERQRKDEERIAELEREKKVLMQQLREKNREKQRETARKEKEALRHKKKNEDEMRKKLEQAKSNNYAPPKYESINVKKGEGRAMNDQVRVQMHEREADAESGRGFTKVVQNFVCWVFKYLPF